jgi:hypothetical protein
MNNEQLSYPIGRFSPPTRIDTAIINTWIATIEEAPQRYEQAVAGMTDTQLDTPYRADGWTVRQVVHHVADSHMNSYIRFHWALTEPNPTIKAYDEKSWAALSYQEKVPVSISLQLLENLHKRWAILLRALSPEELEKTFVHPETGKINVLKEVVGLYAWHSEHHLHHILRLKERMGW